MTKFENGPVWQERKETNFIVVHSSLTPASREDGVEYLRSRHMRQGCVDVGYHYVIRRNGVIEQGRVLHAMGQHCGDNDIDSVGICLIGGGDSKHRPRKAGPDYTTTQMRSLAHLCLMLVRLYPEAEVCGHNRFASTSKCPLFSVNAWWADLSTRLRDLGDSQVVSGFRLRAGKE